MVPAPRNDTLHADVRWFVSAIGNVVGLIGDAKQPADGDVTCKNCSERVVTADTCLWRSVARDTGNFT